MAKQYKIIKATHDKLVGVIFECVIINDVKAPIWFQDFVDKQFKPLAKDVTDLKVRMTNVETRLDKLETRLDTVITLNNLKTESSC